MPSTEPNMSRRALVAAGTWPADSQPKSRAMDTTIRVDSAVTTLINVFTLEPENQPKLLAVLRGDLQSLVERTPGWISTNVLKSRDGRQVVIYSQWRDEKDLQAFRQDPRAKPYMQQVAALATLAAFTCDVSESRHA